MMHIYRLLLFSMYIILQYYFYIKICINTMIIGNFACRPINIKLIHCSKYDILCIEMNNTQYHDCSLFRQCKTCDYLWTIYTHCTRAKQIMNHTNIYKHNKNIQFYTTKYNIDQSIDHNQHDAYYNDIPYGVEDTIPSILDLYPNITNKTIELAENIYI